ncbi:uncharacterized protein DS421_14g470490 [Arachis hypogaea]|nr:uncharacterized protein DS421_14g470490 [Arachis hypogaea]
MSSSKQNASCVLMWLRHVSSMQQHAICVSSVSMQETSPTPKTGVIYGEGWCRKCIKEWWNFGLHANRNLLSLKLDQPETWHPAIDQALRTTGFYQLSKVEVIREHFVMLSALVERWRPKTHTFVMSVGEVTVTLEDVLHIFGLPIDEEVVSDWTDSSDERTFAWSRNLRINPHCKYSF